MYTEATNRWETRKKKYHIELSSLPFSEGIVAVLVPFPFYRKQPVSWCNFLGGSRFPTLRGGEWCDGADVFAELITTRIIFKTLFATKCMRFVAEIQKGFISPPC